MSSRHLSKNKKNRACITWISGESIPERGQKSQGPGVMGASRVQRPTKSWSNGGSMTGGGSDQ